MVSIDATLDALFRPFADGELDRAWLGQAVFVRARAGAWQASWPALACVQTFRPHADELVRAGAMLADAGSWPATRCVLLLPQRQRDEARALLARALRHVGAGGLLIACQPNDEGARSGEADLRRLAGAVCSRSRHKCRAYWTFADAATLDEALAAEWAALDAPRALGHGRWIGRPGLFSWDRVDPASALLAAHLSPAIAGRVADLGAGWGWLAAQVVLRCPEVGSIDLYEAEQRAEVAALANVARACRDAGREVAREFRWHDVVHGIDAAYDAIVSNPPFHQGRADDPGLGRAFIRAAATGLAPQGTLLLVANRHLPYEAALAQGFGRVRVLAERDGFKLFEAREPRA